MRRCECNSCGREAEQEQERIQDRIDQYWAEAREYYAQLEAEEDYARWHRENVS